MSIKSNVFVSKIVDIHYPISLGELQCMLSGMVIFMGIWAYVAMLIKIVCVWWISSLQPKEFFFCHYHLLVLFILYRKIIKYIFQVLILCVIILFWSNKQGSSSFTRLRSNICEKFKGVKGCSEQGWNRDAKNALLILTHPKWKTSVT